MGSKFVLTCLIKSGGFYQLPNCVLVLRRDNNEEWTSHRESGAGQRAYIAQKETANLVKLCPLKFSP